MTSSIDFIPSPFDRSDPVARAIRWWTTTMADILGRRRFAPLDAAGLEDRKKVSSRHVSLTLPETEAFYATLTLPRGPVSAHENAIRLRMAELAPVDPALLSVAATAIEEGEDGSITYAISMARPDRLLDLEKTARRKGAAAVRFHAADQPSAEMRSPAARRQAGRQVLIDGGLAVAVIASAAIAVGFWANRLTIEANGLASEERDLRRSAVAATAARKDAEIADEFISRGILERRAGSALGALSAINQATPDGAWWVSLKWTPQEAILSAQASDATKAIKSMSANAKPGTVELRGTISPVPNGPQAFELTLRPRPGATP